ncbi:MAG: hypothetical protein K2N61_02835 [Lachnospiraceae bacterium]|nr:hypothetical protein [Lachnospiraceae bacterium]
MRQEILKIYVDKKEMETIKSCDYCEISYIKRSDELPVKKGDFVVFTDGESEFIRQLLKISDKKILYTSLWTPAGGSQQHSLVIVMTLLYQSIINLRYSEIIHKEFYLDTQFFSLEQVENELEMIRISMLLLEKKIGITEYIKELEFYSEIAEDCRCESAALILKQSMWNCTLSKEQTKAVNRIKAAMYEMEACLKNPKEWGKISRIAYRIHNEPDEIMGKLV